MMIELYLRKSLNLSHYSLTSFVETLPCLLHFHCVYALRGKLCWGSVVRYNLFDFELKEESDQKILHCFVMNGAA